MQSARPWSRGAAARVLALCSTAFVLALLAPACGGGNSNGGGSGCTLGGAKCAYGCTAGLGCTNCVADADCKDSGKPACVLGQCQQCGPTKDCGAAQACFPKDSKCHARCTTDTDCPGDAPICLTDSGTCVGCQGDVDCAASKGTPLCSAARAQCAECASPADCGARAPACDLNDGSCHECLVDADCGTPRACGADRKCHLACSADNDCDDLKKPFCDLSSRDCVACLGNQDCGSAAPFCKGDQCVACAADSDCADPGLPICKGDVCVQCDKDQDCLDPAFPTCSKQLCTAK